jgi:hypothetical protein
MALAGLMTVLTLAGCGSGASISDPTPLSSASSPTPKAASFDPCTDIPEKVLDAENLERLGPHDASIGEIISKGCGYADRQGDGYDVRIMKTNITLEQIKAKYPNSREQQISGRDVVFYDTYAGRRPEICTLNVAIASGSVEFDLHNPKRAPRTGSQAACDLVTHLTEEVMPSISPNS